ncbi:MAG: GntR family transcriptional regulator [Longimicrobiaceae bacterium]
MTPSSGITERLRDRVIGELHLGRLHAGDRLSGVRELAEEYDVGVRAVVRAYRALEKEGLVEIRSRSGVYVAPQERLDEEVLEETASWLADTLIEALKRRITIPGLPEFVRRCTATLRPRCVLLESTEDHLTILSTELRDEYGFDVHPVDLAALGEGRSRESADGEGLANSVGGAHLLVTTTYHAASARVIADSLQKPLVVVTAHPNTASTLERHLRCGTLTVVCVDAAFGERMRAVYGGRFPGRVRVVLAGDGESLRALDPEEPVLLTLAARQRLGATPLRSLLPHSPSISPESGRELTQLLVRLNVAAERSR